VAAKSKKARLVRTADEFDLGRLVQMLQMPRDGRSTIHAWSLSQIFEARNAQMRGDFLLAARLAESMRTDDALAVAYENRLAPQRCIPVEMRPAKNARGAAIAKEAEALFGQDGIGIHPDTTSDIEGCLVNHGVAFGTCVATPREDGSRIDFELKYWPIEYVKWDQFYRVFKTRVDFTEISAGDMPNDPSLGPLSAYEVPIIHGDGRWVIFKKHEIDPFKQEAAIIPASIVWARHAFAARDWAKSSVAHGSAKVLGTMPEGVALQNADGVQTREASAMIELLRSIASSDSPVGLKPFGSVVDFMTNNSTAWQVFSELVSNAEKAAARIYLGTDGTLGTQGGAPGVDIESLFGVAATKVEGDLRCIERGILTGVIEPWCALNFGDSSLAPKRCYKIADDDENADRAELAKRNAAFWADLKGSRDAGIAITQEYVDGLAGDYGVRAPKLPVAPAPAAPPVAA
jgi:hypothetical protein